MLFIIIAIRKITTVLACKHLKTLPLLKKFNFSYYTILDNKKDSSDNEDLSDISIPLDLDLNPSDSLYSMKT